MSSIKMFKSYEDAMAFYKTLNRDQEPSITADVEFQSYVVEFYK